MANQESLQSLFDAAQKELSAKKYPEAKEILLKIKEQGFSSPSLEASMGRAQFESGEQGEGIVAWTQAVALDRFESTYRSDLAFAQSKVQNGTKLEHPSEFANQIASYARPAEQFFAGSLLLLIIIWLYLAGLLGKLGKGLRLTLAVFVVLIFASGVFSLSSRSLATVLTKTTLKPAPLESAEGTLEVNSGSRVRILKSSGNYTEIERPNAFRGWVDTKNLSRSPY